MSTVIPTFPGQNVGRDLPNHLKTPWQIARLTQRFWDHVSVGDDCWVWTAKVNRGRYGILVWKPVVLAHRFSWFLHHGRMPVGLCVCHSCDNPRCVNPAHLFGGSLLDNIADRHRKGRSSRGESRPGAIFTEKEVAEIKASKATVRELMLKYRASESSIRHIRNGLIWKHVVPGAAA